MLQAQGLLGAEPLPWRLLGAAIPAGGSVLRRMDLCLSSLDVIAQSSGASPVVLPFAVSRYLCLHGPHRRGKAAEVTAMRVHLSQVGFLCASNKSLGVLVNLSRLSGRARKLGSEAKPPESWDSRGQAIGIKSRTKNESSEDTTDTTVPAASRDWMQLPPSAAWSLCRPFIFLSLASKSKPQGEALIEGPWARACTLAVRGIRKASVCLSHLRQ